MCAMIAHAAAESSKGTVSGTHVVVLSSKDVGALHKLEQRLITAEISHSAFREPDPPYNGALMSIGIEPVRDRRMVRRFLAGFSLLGEDHAKLERRPGTAAKGNQRNEAHGA
jgi:hypothetical protein